MTRPSPLDNPEHATFAWTRYRRLMSLMGGVTLVVVAGVLLLLHRVNDALPIHFYIATGLGIGAAMMLMAALMGLVFLSHGTGHDESIEDPLDDERD